MYTSYITHGEQIDLRTIHNYGRNRTHRMSRRAHISQIAQLPILQVVETLLTTPFYVAGWPIVDYLITN